MSTWEGFPGGSAVKNPLAMQEPQGTRVRSLDQKDPLEEEMATHYSILSLENPHGQRSLVDNSPWGRKESDTTEHLTHRGTGKC